VRKESSYVAGGEDTIRVILMYGRSIFLRMSDESGSSTFARLF